MVLETGQHPSVIKDDVTTPAGCTIAGLLSMEDGKIRSTLARAVQVCHFLFANFMILNAYIYILILDCCL
jgi:pyrroline-5-carboxylate reductase